MKSLTVFYIALSPLLSSVIALGQNATVTTVGPAPGLLQLAGNGLDGQILLSADDWWGVIRAADDLAVDFGKVTGKNLTLGNWGSVGPSTNGTNRTVLGVKQRTASGSLSPGSGSGSAHLGNRRWGDPGLQSGGHNEMFIDGDSTTVYYTYNPVTSFVNVSSQTKFWGRASVKKNSTRPAQRRTSQALPFLIPHLPDLS